MFHRSRLVFVAGGSKKTTPANRESKRGERGLIQIIIQVLKIEPPGAFKTSRLLPELLLYLSDMK